MIDSKLIWLLPIVFIFHDFEEIIMMDAWIKKNKTTLLTKFPVLGKRIISMYANLSTASFSLAVFEEFLILVLAAVLTIYFNWSILWIACFMAFSIHLIMHIVQWIIIRKYIPAIITSFLSFIYSAYTLKQIIEIKTFSGFELLIITLAGLILMAINLLIAHKLAAIFEKFLVKFGSK